MNKNNDYRSRLLWGLIMLRIFSKLGLIVSINPQPLWRLPGHLVADVCTHPCTSSSVTYYSLKVVYDIDDQAWKYILALSQEFTVWKTEAISRGNIKRDIVRGLKVGMRSIEQVWDSEGTEMKKSKLVCDKGKMEPLGVKSRDTNLVSVLFPTSVSMNPGLPQFLPLGCCVITPVFNLELV